MDSTFLDTFFFKTTPATGERDNGVTSSTFEVDEYTGDWLLIGWFLTTLTLYLLWTNEDAQKIRKKAYIYFL